MQLLQRELEQQLYAQVKLHSAFDKQLQYLLLLAMNKVDSNLYLFWFNMTEHGNLFFY